MCCIMGYHFLDTFLAFQPSNIALLFAYFYCNGLLHISAISTEVHMHNLLSLLCYSTISALNEI